VSVLVIGLSHKATPVELLERAALTPQAATKLLLDALACDHVSESVVIATCNRVEVYAEVDRFHGAVDELAQLLARHSGLSQDELTPHLNVRFEDGAVAHLFSVICGLDSMVVGETQILGQAKTALRKAQDAETVGPSLNQLFQQALRVGKRAHTETELGRAGRSVVSAAFRQAEHVLGSPLERPRVLVVGAGSMAALAATVATRDYNAEVTIANRSPEPARRLAESVGGTTRALDDVGAAIPDADIVVTCTGAIGTVLGPGHFAAVPAGSTQVVLDLAMPRDVAPEVGERPGITVIGLAELGEALNNHAAASAAVGATVDEVRQIVADELAAFASNRRAAAATPTVVALRSMAAEVVRAELTRLSARLPELPDQTYGEVEKTMRRVVDKLLHAPTIRVKQLAEQPVETSYTDALRELFALDPATIEALSSPEPDATAPEAGHSEEEGQA
jgi:glutamyl-tRNA reductase